MSSYYDSIQKTGDPYIDKTGKFKNELLDLFYPFIDEGTDLPKIKVECIRIDYRNKTVSNIFYHYFDSNYRLLSSNKWRGNKFKKLYKNIKQLFTLSTVISSVSSI